MAVENFLVLGPHGSGVSTALDLYADFGFLTLAGVDPQQVSQTVSPLLSGEKPVAFSLSIEPGSDAATIAQSITTLKEQTPHLRILTLDAPIETLTQRYTQSGKAHPFERTGLKQAIEEEKRLYEPLKGLKDYSIDTSTTTPAELHHKIAKVLGRPIENQDFTVYITSFGFKYGAPQDAELMFDMRFMTNPFYDENLRPMTGQDKPVQDFIFNLEHARRFFESWSDMIALMLPLYRAEGKTRLTIAVGCTGGKHRSVCMAEELARYLRENCPTFHIVITHREMLRWGKQAEIGPEVGSIPPSSRGEAS